MSNRLYFNSYEHSKSARSCTRILVSHYLLAFLASSSGLKIQGEARLAFVHRALCIVLDCF